VAVAVIVKFNASNVKGHGTVGKPKMRLYVNIDHVATVRQARRAAEPDPLEAAALCEAAGADGITVHLREDRRHIQDHDVERLRAAVRTVLNLELAAAPEIVAIAARLVPHQATFVPERRQEVTTEGGLDLTAHAGHADARLAEGIRCLREAGIRISLFIDPDPATIDEAARLGVAAVELHTGEYANHYATSPAPLERLRQATAHAKAAGLAVHAGHGLTYRNVAPVAAIAAVEELNIGHSIVSRAIMVGLEPAVREMRQLVDAARVD
jgi:pyridoxine 5-phosphate synthase